jgi:hypothetical protein
MLVVRYGDGKFMETIAFLTQKGGAHLLVGQSGQE